MLSAPEAPTAPVEPATAPTPDVPTDAPATEPAPVEAPVPVVDEEKALLADLEARRQARQQKQFVQPNSEVAELKAQLLELKQQLSTQSQPKDLRALIAEHGEVEGLRRYGIDPLQFFDGFKKHAKGVDPNVGKALELATEAKAKADAIEKARGEETQTNDQRARIEAVRQTERAFLRVTEDPATGLQFLGKMEPHARIARTYAKIEALQNDGYDTDHLSDHQLAKLVDADIRAEIQRLTGTDPGVTTTTTVPATDGAKKPATPALTNDLASQSTGKERILTERERHLLAVRMLETGATE